MNRFFKTDLLVRLVTLTTPIFLILFTYLLNIFSFYEKYVLVTSFVGLLSLFSVSGIESVASRDMDSKYIDILVYRLFVFSPVVIAIFCIYVYLVEVAFWADFLLLSSFAVSMFFLNNLLCSWVVRFIDMAQYIVFFKILSSFFLVLSFYFESFLWATIVNMILVFFFLVKLKTVGRRGANEKLGLGEVQFKFKKFSSFGVDNLVNILVSSIGTSQTLFFFHVTYKLYYVSRNISFVFIRKLMFGGSKISKKTHNIKLSVLAYFVLLSAGVGFAFFIQHLIGRSFFSKDNLWFVLYFVLMSTVSTTLYFWKEVLVWPKAYVRLEALGGGVFLILFSCFLYVENGFQSPTPILFLTAYFLGACVRDLLMMVCYRERQVE